MKHLKKRLLAGFSALALTLTLIPAALAAQPLTRGEARDILAAAADDYAGLDREELLRGDGSEDLYVVTCFSDRDKLLRLTQRQQ